MEEMFDTFDVDGKFLGVKPKSFCHSANPGVYHKPVWIWIVNSKGEVYVQQRSSQKKFCPNDWETLGGHVASGERFVDACQRETEEEIGLKFDKRKFKFQGEVVAPEVWEIGQVYLLRADFEIKDIKLQKEEVSQAKWLPFEKFKKFLYSKEFTPYDENYRQFICSMLTKNLEQIKN